MESISITEDCPTFGLHDEEQYEEQFEYQETTIYDVVPPRDGFQCPGINKLVERDRRHDCQVLRRPSD